MIAEKSEQPVSGPSLSAATVGVGFVLNGRPVIESSELFAGANSLVIRHQGAEYNLEPTRNGKLILKK